MQNSFYVLFYRIKIIFLNFPKAIYIQDYLNLLYSSIIIQIFEFFKQHKFSFQTNHFFNNYFQLKWIELNKQKLKNRKTSKQAKVRMLKRKLQPLKKPTNFNQFTKDQILIEYMSELLQQQKRTNDLLQKNLTRQRKQQDFNGSPMSEFEKKQNKLLHSDIRSNGPVISINDNQLIQMGSNSKFNNDVTDLEPGSLIVPQGQDLLEQAIVQKIPNNESLKKSYNVLNQFLQYTDRRQFKILVDFNKIAKEFPVISNIHVLDKITTEWVGEVFRMVASMCWNMMLNGFLTYDQTKILFTQNVIYNYIQFMRELEERAFKEYKHHLTSLINRKSISVLQFLGKQFPQTKIEAPNIHLKEIIPNTNNASRMKFDVVAIANAKIDFQITYRQNSNYSVEIMKLINFIIEQTNQSYLQYQKECHNIFQQVLKMPERRAGPNQQIDFSNKQPKPQDLNQTTQDIIYREKVRKYTKFLIGRKVNKNVPKFTREQINNGVFYAKSPSILRIITKWVEQLIQIIKDPYKHIFSADKQLKSHDGNYVLLFGTVRKAICQKIIQKRDELFKKIQAIKQECFLIQSILSSPKYTSDSTQLHLSPEQISVGKFSVYVQKAISAYMFQQLNQILHFLLSIPLEVDQKSVGEDDDFYQSEIRKQLDKINLVSMKIFDLLRCKCISNQEEIIWIMKYLIDRNLVGDFKLVRVKDRLNQGTRDINCNIRFKRRGFVSQMQLSVVSNIQSKQQKLDSYNHFLYELKRSKLGPLSENVSIWTVLQQRSSYFQNISRNAIPQNPKIHKCSNENLQKFARPICCESCSNFYPYPQTVYSNVKCKKCKQTYCGQCYSRILSDSDKKAMIFQGMFKQPTLSHVLQHSDSSQPFPLQGIYFKRYHERRQINFFTVLIKDRQTQLPITHQSLKQLCKDQKQIQCQIIFTHNCIRNSKAIQKQKNIDCTIRASFKNDNQIYIDKKDYSFFSKYLIFYFDKQFQSSRMTLSQIQKFLRSQQNQKIKVADIMFDPTFVDETKFLKKKSQKLRQLASLKSIFKDSPEQEFLTYRFNRIFIVAKVYKDPFGLGNSINYANNIDEIKQYAKTQRSVISMEKHNITSQFTNLTNDINPNLVQSLCKNLRKVYLNHNYLDNLKGLKNLIYLEVLYIRHCGLTSLQGVQEMTLLMILRFDDNKVENLEPLAPCVNLRRLMGNDNKVSSLQPIRNLIQLKTVEFEKNQIDSLEPIKHITQIQDLNFKNNPLLVNLPIFMSKNIKSLSFSKTNIKQFQDIGSHTKINRLMLEGLHLKEIPSFIKQMKLTQLWLGGNQITQITNLQDQCDLQILSLKSNKITSLGRLQNLQKIQILYLQNNQITSLNGIKHCFQTLRLLSIKQNPLDDLGELIYAQNTLKFDYTKQKLTINAQNFIEDLYSNKINSSGSDD